MAYTEGSIQAVFRLWFITQINIWGPIASELLSEATLDSGIQGHYASSALMLGASLVPGLPLYAGRHVRFSENLGQMLRSVLMVSLAPCLRAWPWEVSSWMDMALMTGRLLIKNHKVLCGGFVIWMVFVCLHKAWLEYYCSWFMIWLNARF